LLLQRFFYFRLDAVYKPSNVGKFPDGLVATLVIPLSLIKNMWGDISVRRTTIGIEVQLLEPRLHRLQPELDRLALLTKTEELLKTAELPLELLVC
jgi:hypothetical protein